MNGHRHNLRARFQKVGLEGFADYEQIELFLTLCIPRKDVKPLAKMICKKFENLKGFLETPVEILQDLQGLGPSTTLTIQIFKSIFQTYLRQKAEEPYIFSSLDRVQNYWRATFGGLKNEVFEVAYLDNQNHLLRDGILRLNEGIVNRAVVYPRKVFEFALRIGASAVILAHNHPSGSEEPSESDKRLTEAIVATSHILSIRILDHIIVGRNQVFSFRQQGLLPQ